MSILTLITTFLGSLFKSQRQLALENLALRQQVTMLWQSVKRHRATAYGWPNPYPLSTPGSTNQPASSEGVSYRLGLSKADIAARVLLLAPG